MPKYRSALPQLEQGTKFLTDAGIETVLMFRHGVDLPHFAAVHLLNTEEGRQRLHDYFLDFVELAKQHRVGLVLESATWRASPEWGGKLGYSAATLEELNRRSITMLQDIRAAHASAGTPMVISGCIGPRGDGYRPSATMSAAEAEAYHRMQAHTFSEAEADMVTAITINYVEEAIGITRAAVAEGMPVAISLTVETDGRLPTGQPLRDAIEQVDAETGNAPAYYMITCAHPTHFEHVLEAGTPWVQRIGGLRANASARSHAELDAATELDAGNPVELGAQYRALLKVLPNLEVLGGCCGTDVRHVSEIARACLP